MENDITKRINALEKQIADLKKQNLAMFGRTYSQVGDTSADLVLNTRGQVKIRYGNKFIDLLKDGKINVDTDIIFTANSADSLGSRDGIYILDDGSVYLKYKDKQLQLIGQIGTTYVSFAETQETTVEQKLQALHNIGFYYGSLDDIDEATNGIVFIEADQKLYIVKDGVATDFITIIQQGIKNSESEKDTDKESNTDLPFRVEAEKISFNYPLIINKAHSNNAIKEENGFYLYQNEDGNYVLEIDKLIVHNSEITPQMDTRFWNDHMNMIVNTQYDSENQNPEESQVSTWINDFTKVPFTIQLKFPSTLIDGDELYAYSYYKDENRNNSKAYYIKLTIVDGNTEDSEKVTFNVLGDLSFCTLDFNLSEETQEQYDYWNNIFAERVKSAISNLIGAIVTTESSSVDNMAGLIVLHYGQELLNGWQICDGTNGTPDLTNQHLRDSNGNIIAYYITKI